MLQRRGCYLVQVLVFLDNKNPTPDKHFVFYSGSELLDNQKNVKAVVIEESERQMKKLFIISYMYIDNLFFICLKCLCAFSQ